MPNDIEHRTFRLTCLLLILSVALATSPEIVQKRVDEYLADRRHDMTKLHSVLESGSMNGLFKTAELFDIFFRLQKQYPQFVSVETIGKTVQDRPMYMFRLVKPSKSSAPIKKSKILFTGTHHARELLTPSMTLKIYIDALHSLLNDTGELTFWNFNDMLIIPIVNIDGHTLISESYGKPEWHSLKMKRKNMNNDFCP